jgi:hypothetical protein
VWRRLKSHTPAVTAGAVVAAGAVAASQLTGVAMSGPPANRGNQAPSGATCSGANSSGAAADCTATTDSGCGDQSGHTSTPHTVINIFNLLCGLPCCEGYYLQWDKLCLKGLKCFKYAFDAYFT